MRAPSVAAAGADLRHSSESATCISAWPNATVTR
jgi:hypothetical protein